ncbi:MAG TPA: hypothetical protein VL992_15635 [Tepidisphaeraceae bacterium]|nr:hypothetical protein [Tepidisphaeraceae bacterium]
MLAGLFVWALTAYGALGALFALAFVTAGVQRIDSEAKGSGLAFRLLIFPGTIAFWPLLLRRWLHGAPDPAVEQNPHRDAAALESPQ